MTGQHAVTNPYCQKFQWLNCDIEFRRGSELEWVYYNINLCVTFSIFLHLYIWLDFPCTSPKHPPRRSSSCTQQWYKFSCFIPLWSACLRNIHPRYGLTQPCQSFAYTNIEYDMDYNSFPPEFESQNPQPAADEDEYDYEDRKRERISEFKGTFLLDPENF